MDIKANYRWLWKSILLLGAITIALPFSSALADDDDDDDEEEYSQVSLSSWTVSPEHSLVVLLPDDVPLDDPKVQAWVDALKEEGLQYRLMRDSTFLNLDSAETEIGGLILPDQIHQRASDTLVTAIRQYVAEGGQLMLVYDAGALKANGFYPFTPSRFSDLAGVDYVLYNELRDYTIGLGPVYGVESTLWELQVPPGKSMPFPAAENDFPLYVASNEDDAGGLSHYTHETYQTWLNSGGDDDDSQLLIGEKVEASEYTVEEDSSYESEEYSDSHDDEEDSLPDPVTPSVLAHGITGYVYGFLKYPSFVTRGEYTGKALMASPSFGLVAGINNFGKGQVLFVNLPLGHLKGQTDGMLMHGFIKYFGVNLLNMPRLARQPGGRGGMVLNWHVDSAGALQPMMQLALQNVWNHGPYSIHFTAGPDTIVPGDGLGLDVLNNDLTQDWIRYFDHQGHQIGSHGGWIHDYYGLNASESNEDQFKPYLIMNKQAIEKYTDRRLTEYSAPQGNNPKWAMDWLEDNRFLAYYFTGHTGMAPTRTYREGALMNPSLWAFPVSTLGEYATFEEFLDYGVDEAAINRWLDALVDFNVNHKTSRLIYFHPPGAAQYPGVMSNLLQRTRQYAGYGKFKWYTMKQLALFNKKRAKVTWTVADGRYGSQHFRAYHPWSLAKQTFILPKAKYKKPYITKGYAYIREDEDNWMVVSRGGDTLKFMTWKAQ